MDDIHEKNPVRMAINSSLTDQPTFEYDESGKITGYKTKIGGADTVFPFKSSNSLALIVRWGSYSGGSSTVPFFYDDTLFNGFKTMYVENILVGRIS